jgi:hypothetical protein
MHSWVCTLHRDENRPLFETHKREFIERKQHILFAHPCISDPGVKHWHSNAPSKKTSIAQPGTDNHKPKPGHNLPDLLAPLGPQGQPLANPTLSLTPECLSPVPTAHQASRFTNVTHDLEAANDVIPDDGIELPVMLARLKNPTPEGDTSPKLRTHPYSCSP